MVLPISLVTNVLKCINEEENTVVAYRVAKLTRTRQEKGGHACCLRTLQAKATERNVQSLTYHTPFPVCPRSFHQLVDDKLIHIEAWLDSEVDLKLHFLSSVLFMIELSTHNQIA